MRAEVRRLRQGETPPIEGECGYADHDGYTYSQCLAVFR